MEGVADGDNGTRRLKSAFCGSTTTPVSPLVRSPLWSSSGWTEHARSIFVGDPARDPGETAARVAAVVTSRTRSSVPMNSADGRTDVDLLARLDVGDPHAMKLLYERYASLAHSVAQRICRDQSLAEDVVQEVFLML